MDFDLRDWLLVLGPILIIGVLIHGFWRMQRNRSTLKMALDESFVSQAEERQHPKAEAGAFNSELPNGGARVRQIPQQTSLNLEEGVPVLMDPVAREETAVHVAENSSVGAVVEADPEAVIENTAEAVIEQAIEEPIYAEVSSSVEQDGGDQAVVATRTETVQQVVPEKIIVIYVIAQHDPFNGEQLRLLLEAQNMSFGEMNIFHRYGDASGESSFSLVNAVEPGFFDPETMAELETPGISLFMRVHELHDPELAYEDMVTVAQTLAEALAGEVKDHSQSMMSLQTIEQARLEIRQFKHKYL
ncbi:MAG: cell division protein ZipA [Pseudomonadales bacterium]|nr:cell division protein ZipA [Pseudomonadales bacterium]